MDATTPPHELPEEGPQPFLRLPWPIGALAGLLVAIEAVLAFAPSSFAQRIIVSYGFIPARYSAAFLAANDLDAGSLADRALPFVTYIFLHGGWAHVIINSVWLLAFGPVVLKRFGTIRFFIFFIVCGVAGALAQLAMSWGSDAPVIGASAAISGLMAAAFRLIGREGNDFIPPQPLAPLFSRRIVLWSALWIVLNIVAGLTGLGTPESGAQLVAWQAHLGGFAAGLLLAGLFDPLNRLKGAAL